MTAPHEHSPTPLETLVHDVQNCLHLVALGMELLKGVRGDDARFAEVSATIARSNGKAMDLLRDYARAANETPT